MFLPCPQKMELLLSGHTQNTNCIAAIKESSVLSHSVKHILANACVAVLNKNFVTQPNTLVLVVFSSVCVRTLPHRLTCHTARAVKTKLESSVSVRMF